MTAKVDRTGQRFKHCTVLREAGVDKKQNVLWECLCDCGKLFTAHGYDLSGGKIISCKCAIKYTTHGMARGGKKRSRIYSVWSAMINRCTSPKDRGYNRYGGRGIYVDPAWRKFETFFADMGEPPFVGATLDRKDNNGPYSKENCRWATTTQQGRNRSDNVRVSIAGMEMILADWCKLLGISNSSVWYYTKTKNLTTTEAVEYVIDNKRRQGKRRSKETTHEVQNLPGKRCRQFSRRC